LEYPIVHGWRRDVTRFQKLGHFEFVPADQSLPGSLARSDRRLDAALACRIAGVPAAPNCRIAGVPGVMPRWRDAASFELKSGS
jgi:hypothetical protein